MSFFDWFFRRPLHISAQAGDSARAAHNGQRPAVVLPRRLSPEAGISEDARKVKRQARREQMYTALREAMTRAGVLSASYKFKVLSLDQGGDEFFAMIDLQRVAGDPLPQLGVIETLIVQTARQRFGITVPAVYWRVQEVAKLAPDAGTADEGALAAVPGKAVAPGFEPIQADEVAAFKQALLAASAAEPATEKGSAKRSGRRVFAPKRSDFEDTKVSDFVSSPLLSATQYGELN